jgi:predicted amidohydrolase
MMNHPLAPYPEFSGDALTEGTVSDPAPSYRALALQVRARSVSGCGSEEARSLIKSALERVRRQVEASLRFIGSDCRLVVLPEYFLTGHPLGEPVPAWADLAAIEVEGPEYESLRSMAQGLGIFLAGNAYETDRNFPGIYFQACFLIDPAGEVVLRYRRLNSMFTPTPHDVWDRYLEIYGVGSIFPVARTEIGNLACVASEEILFPELARCFAMRGAEVILNPTSEAGSPQLTPKHVARRARAIENLVYVVSANTAGIEGSPIPEDSADGGSQIVDYEGRVLSEAGRGESMVANAGLDMGALRRARRRPGMANLLARNRFDLYAESYGAALFHRANGFGDGSVPDRTAFLEAQQAVIQRLVDEGLI